MYNMKLVKAFKLVFGMQESLSSFQTSQPNTHSNAFLHTGEKITLLHAVLSGWGTEMFQL